MYFNRDDSLLTYCRLLCLSWYIPESKLRCDRVFLYYFMKGFRINVGVNEESCDSYAETVKNFSAIKVSKMSFVSVDTVIIDIFYRTIGMRIMLVGRTRWKKIVFL